MNTQEYYRIAAESYFVWKPSQDIIDQCNRVCIYIQRGFILSLKLAWIKDSHLIAFTELKPSSNGLSHAMGTYPAYVNRLVEIKQFFMSYNWLIDEINSNNDTIYYDKKGQS